MRSCSLAGRTLELSDFHRYFNVCPGFRSAFLAECLKILQKMSQKYKKSIFWLRYPQMASGSLMRHFEAIFRHCVFDSKKSNTGGRQTSLMHFVVAKCKRGLLWIDAAFEKWSLRSRSSLSWSRKSVQKIVAFIINSSGGKRGKKSDKTQCYVLPYFCCFTGCSKKF